MDFTYEQFKLCIRSAILSCKTSFSLDVQELTKEEISQIIVWCERDGYGYEYNENANMIKIDILKGFGR